MPTNSDKKDASQSRPTDATKRRRVSVPILGGLSLIATLATAVPAIVASNREHADVYFSLSRSRLSLPEVFDDTRQSEIRKLLLENGIPLQTLTLELINQGNTAATEIKVSIPPPGVTFITWSDPPDDKFIWVDMPNLSDLVENQKPGSELQFVLREMVAGLPLRIHFGYKEMSWVTFNPDNVEQENKEPMVIFDGKRAKEVADITTVPEWSQWSAFRLPAQVFLGGVGVIVIWVITLAFIENPTLLAAFVRAFSDIL